MSGDPLLVDTNILIHHWNGDPRTTRLLDNKLIHISFISEIEVLGFHGYTAHERAKVIADLAFIRIIDMDAGIKAVAIDLCAKDRMKLADALIAATAIRTGIPLVTEDKHFRKLKGMLELVEL
ncbi:MAG TPA: PIN domain-containing protein [Flavobacteriales bacterium]|nr:PIN domain-containing protein [Flavobacteriales bacterium]HNI05941.1 PIN domain-containing protein [Flavobacteriales bacterium]HNK42554.1 PIN domain-containing protein [Flavobacteriales bacterium]HNK70206.1 PIN domain-containing protein [Flavobacteriales bacterium]HNK86211.1 PIN domain-containing protein [Flavobacteriales bacterium]